MEKMHKLLVVLALSSSITACVTQQYGKDNTPVVENEASNDEIAMTRVSLGLGYLKIGNTTQAKANLEKAKRYSPKLVQVHTAFAHYYETVGEPELASNAFQTALSIKGNEPDTLNNYGVFLCRQGDVEGAQEQFLKAIAVPDYLRVSESYENLALCHLNAENFDKVEMYLAKAIMHSPSSPSALQQMAQLNYVKGDYPQAQKYVARYEKATRQFNPSALALAYKIYEKQGKMAIAKNYGAMLVKMFPNAFEAKQYLLNNLAYIDADKLAESYQNQQKHSQAKKVIVLSPTKNKANQAVDDSMIASFEINEPENDTNKEPLAVQPEKSAKGQVVNEINKAYPEVKIETKPQHNSLVKSLPIHVVQSGESVYSISKKYSLKMRSIQKWNSLSSLTVLKIGQVLVLADPSQSN